VICDDVNDGIADVDLAEFREVCSSEAIDDPGVRGVLAKGLYGARKDKFGDLESPVAGLPSEDSNVGSTGRGLPASGEPSPFAPPNLIRLERWSKMEVGSSEKAWVREGGDADGIGLKGGNMAEGES
jgi:hypothetical protein